MNQEERDIRLLEYWQGESLSPEEVREVENWLGEKVENRRYFEDLQREFLRQRWVMRETWNTSKRWQPNFPVPS